MTNLVSKKSAISALVGLLCASPAFSSGYHFGTQSVSSQSTANSSSAEAADASTIFYNAAGLAKLEGSNISVNMNLVAPSVKYSHAHANYPSGEPQSVPGVTKGKITKSIAGAPHLYASHQLSDDLTLGLGVYIPFASETEYQRDSVLRYNINKMGLTSIDINPTLAYKINDSHSIAVGVIGQYSTAELRQFANLGRFAKLPNGIMESYADVKGSDWGFGFNLGYLWDVNDRVRLGMSYHSKVEHTLDGTAKWRVPAEIAGTVGSPAIGYMAKEGAQVGITTPESLSLHGMVKFDDKWTGFGDITWTRHSRFDKLAIDYEYSKVVANAVSGGVDRSDKTMMRPNWRNSYKIGIGGAYQYSDPLELRFGVAFDQSPVKSADYRMSTLPDNHRMWFSVGAKYDFSENSSINIGYTYLHIKETKANVNGWCGSMTPSGPGAKNCVSSRTSGSAKFKSKAHTLGIQYNYRF